MKTTMIKVMMLPLIASMFLLACTKDEDEPQISSPKSPVDGKVLVASGSSSEAEVDIEVYADQDLFVGYNKLYTVIYQSGTKNMIDGGHVTYQPMMNMVSGMMHTCPTEQPSSTTPDNGVYDGAIIPIMPSGDMGSWMLNVTVHNHTNNVEATVEMGMTVTTPTDARQYSYIDPNDGKGYFVTMVEPSAPVEGLNDFEVTIHMRESMMSFPAVTSRIVEIEPEMPTMGHGSVGNVNPVHMEDGHYLGKVNLSMPGYWQINMTIKDESDNILNSGSSFDINF